MLNTLFRKIANNFQLINNPILINAFVYHRDGKVVVENWGDDINYFFLREICKRPIAMYDQYSLAFRLKMKNYLVVGSTIDMLCKQNTEVWGAGIIDGAKPLNMLPKKVHAVRGPLTRQALIKQGVDCPEVFGDPALLVAKYYQPNVAKKYKYGYISHVSNLDKVSNLKIDGLPITDRKDILLIDISKYNKWTDIPDQICSCENIISASLHGLIMAEAYNIPNVWIEIGRPLIGGHFKFHDFFLSIGRDRKAPITIKNSTLEIEKVCKSIDEWKSGDLDLQPLINACPFELKKELLCLND